MRPAHWYVVKKDTPWVDLVAVRQPTLGVLAILRVQVNADPAPFCDFRGQGRCSRSVKHIEYQVSGKTRVWGLLE